MTLQKEMDTALAGTSVTDLLKLTEALYNDVRTSIASGEDVSHEAFRACNAARKEIEECKKLGIGG